MQSQLSKVKTASAVLLCSLFWLTLSLSATRAAAGETEPATIDAAIAETGLSTNAEMASSQTSASETSSQQLDSESNPIVPLQTASVGTSPDGTIVTTPPLPIQTPDAKVASQQKGWAANLPNSGQFSTAAVSLQPPAGATVLQKGYPSLPIAQNSLNPDVLSLEPQESSSDTNLYLANLNSVSELSDVQPTDWAFQALQSLVDKYSCIVGYPDRTYRGNRALSRYEFAAGLNACLDGIIRSITVATADLESREDLATLQRLQEEFAAELASLRGRTDALEIRTAELAANQFSTTTKLFGQAIFAVQGGDGGTSDFFPVDGVKDTRADANINIISNVQLTLFTQFDNRSILLVGLQTGRGQSLQGELLTNMARLAYEGDTNGSVVLSDLSFRFLLNNSIALILGTNGVNMPNVLRGTNPIESAGQGPLSAFAQRNPILNIGAGQGGLGFDWQLADQLSLQAVYSAGNPNSPADGAGLFNGRSTTGVQLNFSPTDEIDLALNYVNSYSPDGFLSTGIGDDQLSLGSPLTTNAFGGTIAWRLSPQITVGGWGGYGTSSIPGQSGRVETINWMAFVNFPDLLGQGNLAGLYVGQPPRITSSDLPIGNNIPSLLAGGAGTSGGQSGTSTHVEAFYRIRVSDNISITPGVLVIFSPNHTSASDTVTVGALRTTFTF